MPMTTMPMTTLQMQRQKYLKTTIATQNKINPKLAFSPNKHPMSSVFKVPKELPTQNQTQKLSAPGLGAAEITGIVATALNFSATLGTSIFGMVKTFVPAEDNSKSTTDSSNSTTTTTTNNSDKIAEELTNTTSNASNTTDACKLQTQINKADMQILTNKGSITNYEMQEKTLDSQIGNYGKQIDDLNGKNDNIDNTQIPAVNEKADKDLEACDKRMNENIDKQTASLKEQLSKLDSNDPNYTKIETQISDIKTKCENDCKKEKEVIETQRKKDLQKLDDQKADNSKKSAELANKKEELIEKRFRTIPEEINKLNDANNELTEAKKAAVEKLKTIQTVTNPFNK